MEKQNAFGSSSEAFHHLNKSPPSKKVRLVINIIEFVGDKKVSQRVRTTPEMRLESMLVMASRNRARSLATYPDQESMQHVVHWKLLALPVAGMEVAW